MTFKPLASSLLALTLLTGISGPALAGDCHGGGFHGHGGWHGGGWHGSRNIQYFHHRDFGVWRSGHWYHGYHGGALGWWWLAAGGWYLYNAPVYPYPDPYTPPVVVAPAPAPMWYYCDSARGYYPYVPVCQSGWRAVPAR